MLTLFASFFLLQYLLVFPTLYELLEDIESKKLEGCQLLDYFSKYSSGVLVLNQIIEMYAIITSILHCFLTIFFFSDKVLFFDYASCFSSSPLAGWCLVS